MESEPTKAEPPKRKRRWFQFSLRTFMIGVTLAAIPCAYLAHEYRIAHERKAMLDSDCPEASACRGDDEIPFARRWLGDHGIALLAIKDEVPELADQPPPRLRPINRKRGLVCDRLGAR